MLNKKITTIRRYNKIRHKIFLCRDDFNNKLYPGDFVELTVSLETRTPWISRIWWNEIDGAYVDAHPAHNFMSRRKASSTKELRSFLQKKYDIPIHNWEDDSVSEIKKSHSIKKVTYTDYIQWKQGQAKKDKEWKERQEKQE